MKEETMHIEVIQTEQQWDALSGKWNELLSTSITDVPFLRHEYLRAWWQHRGGGEWDSGELYIITARSEAGSLVGIAPLFISKNHAGNPVLFLIGSVEISDFLDLIAAPENHASFAEALLEHLTGPEAPTWDALELHNILEDSPSLPTLQNAAEKLGLSFSQERLQPAPIISLPNDFDVYLESLEKRYRRELVRKMRNILRYFIPTQVTAVNEDDDLDAEMEDFFEMMREEPEKDGFLQGTMMDQMKAVAHAAADNGWLDLRFLMVGREKAAGYFNFVYNNRIWVYNSCMASKFANLSPGIALMGILLQEAIEQGSETFDFLRGDDEYKYQLGGTDRWVVKAEIVR
jgi:CelD/BcsL family acetyltransferase involved in cellulose biosynthesis